MLYLRYLLRPYLLNASTTMKISLSNGAAGGCPYWESPYCARPGSNGLYGKKPVANVKIATGINRFAATSRIVARGRFEAF